MFVKDWFSAALALLMITTVPADAASAPPPSPRKRRHPADEPSDARAVCEQRSRLHESPRE